jgi:hypothetical protein
MAMALQGHFEPYLPFVMGILVSASQMQTDDYEYLNVLRLSIFEAYTGIVLGLCDGQKGHLFIQFVDAVFGLIDLVAQAADSDWAVIEKAVSMAGDICENLTQPAITERLAAKRATLLRLIEMAQAQDSDAYCKTAAQRLMTVRVACGSD